MTEITLYNTRTRRKEPLVPLDPANVRMYVCGPTVYDRAHIGNARAVVVFDVLFRLLRHTYGADHVTYVRNFTDVDDKINARAAATKLPGETELDAVRRITDETIGWYHADMDALGNLRPTFEPRATEFIGPMVAMIETLIARGNAYSAEGHVLFSVASYPDYGKLARRSLDEMRAGARVEVAPYKRDPMDFVLWKPSDVTQPGWSSPWGYGRPGWHIECSAMAHDLLGPSFDIHGGGIDLAFPHHENELAQSACAHPEGDFARIWMHNGMLNVEGDKMSKSLGNFFTVRDLLDRGIPGEVIRFVLLSTHYTQPMDWTERKVDEATTTLRKWRALVEGIEPSSSAASTLVEALAEDLNTPMAIAALHECAAAGNFHALAGSAQVLGLLGTEMGSWYDRESGEAIPPLHDLADLHIDPEVLKQYRYSLQGIQNGLETLGAALGEVVGRIQTEYAPETLGAALGELVGRIQTEYAPEYESAFNGPREWLRHIGAAKDAGVVELIARRENLREAKDFAAADLVREELRAKGFDVVDTQNGAKWSRLDA